MKKLTMNEANKKYYSDAYIKGWENGVEAQFKADIDNAPTIDAVEVVRCKDCKYWHSNTEFCSIWSFHFQNVAQRTLSHDYCSRGERREDGEG